MVSAWFRPECACASSRGTKINLPPLERIRAPLECIKNARKMNDSEQERLRTSLECMKNARQCMILSRNAGERPRNVFECPLNALGMHKKCRGNK